MDVVDGANIITEPLEVAKCPKCGMELGVAGLPAFAGVQCPSCEFEFTVPVRFGPFILTKLLGAGGMGGVYRAKDEALNREVAVKVMLKTLGDDPQFVETFQREAQAAARLNHPNIAHIYSFGQEKGQPYIAMELVDGGSLDAMMNERGPLDPTLAVHICCQIAEGLREASTAGLVHGDIKPENILFDSEKNAKLVDFGLAAMNNNGGEVWGTPYYIAPEKVLRQKTDYRVDIYSLGGTLYHAIAGIPPFDGPDSNAVVKARFEADPIPLIQLRPEIKPELSAMVARMLSRDPAGRYPTYESLLSDMRRILSAAGPVNLHRSSKKIVIKGKSAPSAPPPQPVAAAPAQEAAPPDKNRGCMIAAIVGVGALLGLGAIAGGFWMLMHHNMKKAVRAEYDTTEAVNSKIRSNIKGYMDQSVEWQSKLKGLPEKAEGYAKEALKLAVEALGEEYRERLVPPEENNVVAPKTPTPEAAPAKDAGGAAKQAEAAAEPAKPKFDPKVAFKSLLGGDGKIKPLSDADAGKLSEQLKGLGLSVDTVADFINVLQQFDGQTEAQALVTFGKLPPEEQRSLMAPLEKMQTLTQKMVEAVAVAVTEAMADSPAETAPAADAVDPSVEPVVKAVQGIYQDYYKVKGAASLVESVRKEMAAIVERAEGLVSPVEVTPEAVLLMQDQTEKLKQIAEELTKSFRKMSGAREVGEAPNRVAAMKKSLDQVKELVSDMLERRRKEKAAAEKAEREKAAAEKAEQEKAAAEELAKGEVAKVAATEENNLELIKALDFRGADRALTEAGDEFSSAEGKAALAIARDRVARLESFHNYIVECCNKGYKSAKGWTVDKADKRTVSVNKRPMNWTEIYSKQMAMVNELIFSFVRDTRTTKDMKLRERSRRATEAALFLCTFYSDNASAKKLAFGMAVKAAEDFEPDADTIKQLIPEAFAE